MVWAWHWAASPPPPWLGGELLQGPGPASAPPSRGSLSPLGLPGEACAPHSCPGSSTSAPPSASAGHSHLSGHLSSPSFSPSFLQKMCSGFLSRSTSPSDIAQRGEGSAPAPLRKPPATPHIGAPSSKTPHSTAWNAALGLIHRSTDLPKSKGGHEPCSFEAQRPSEPLPKAKGESSRELCCFHSWTLLTSCRCLSLPQNK